MQSSFATRVRKKKKMEKKSHTPNRAFCVQNLKANGIVLRVEEKGDWHMKIHIRTSSNAAGLDDPARDPCLSYNMFRKARNQAEQSRSLVIYSGEKTPGRKAIREKGAQQDAKTIFLKSPQSL